MTLHIIHLPQRTDRFNLLQKELLEQQITDYSIWNGVIDEITYKGIASAHKQIVAYAKTRNMPEIMIAEDDVHFAAPGAFKFFLSNKPAEFDLYLGGVMWRDNTDEKMIHDFCGLTFYIIAKKFYDIFLQLGKKKDLDRDLAGQGNFLLCNPIVAIQHNGYSDNKKRECNFDRHTQYLNLYQG